MEKRRIQMIEARGRFADNRFIELFIGYIELAFLVRGVTELVNSFGSAIAVAGDGVRPSLPEIERDHGSLYRLGRESRKAVVEHNVIILAARRDHGMYVAACGSA
ncbi:MAG TPA: hypothetical protein VJ810_12555 [Blastocatellia bacterium]|nr:hypothetical protein [Blastocatellia bacterium]